MSTPEAIIAGAIKRLETPGAWKAGALARNREGLRVPATDKKAVFFSLLGALRAARMDLEEHGVPASVALGAERDAIEIIQGASRLRYPISEMDRAPGTTQESLIALLQHVLKSLSALEVVNG